MIEIDCVGWRSLYDDISGDMDHETMKQVKSCHVMRRFLSLLAFICPKGRGWGVYIRTASVQVAPLSDAGA